MQLFTLLKIINWWSTPRFSWAQPVACLASSQVCNRVCLVSQSSRVFACSGAQWCVCACVLCCMHCVCVHPVRVLLLIAAFKVLHGEKVHRRFWRVTAKTCTSCTSGLKSSGLDRVANTGESEREVETTSGRRQLSVRTSVRSLIWHWHAEICGVYVIFAASCLLCLPPLQQPWKVFC